MLPSLLITFRETIEAALVIGIILGYLSKTKQKQYNKFVYIGIITGIIASIIGAVIFVNLSEVFAGEAEEIFEGVVTFIGVVFLTSTIMWMLKQEHFLHDVEHHTAKRIAQAPMYGLFLMSMITVLREGIETVIFLGAANLISPDKNLLGGAIGIILAIIASYIIFKTAITMKLRKFFVVINLLLVLFGANLVYHGTEEFEEGLFEDTSEDREETEGEEFSFVSGLASLTYIFGIFLLWRRIEAGHKV